MWFAPQPGALFRHLNVQKWSETASFFICFSLRHVLRTTPARTFCTSQLPKVFRAWGAFNIFDLEMCLALQQRALFSSLISPNGSACTRRFSEPTLWPSGATKHWTKHSSATCLPVRAIWSSSFWLFLFSFSCLIFSDLLFSSLVFSSLLSLFPPLLLHLSTLSEVWLLNFVRLTILVDPTAWYLPIRDPHTLVMSPACWPLGQVTTHGIRPDLAAQHVLEQLQNLQLWQLWHLQISGVEMGDINFYDLLWIIFL